MAKPDHAVWLAGRMYELSNDENSTDFTLRAGRALVRCHKLVVSACSNVLRSMCRDGETEKWLDCEGNYEKCNRTLHDLHNFMYLGIINLRDINVESMLRAATSIEHLKLRDLCEQFMLNQLNVMKGQSYEIIARKYDLQRLFEGCQKLKKDRFMDVIHTGWFQDMSVDAAYDYLQARDLQIGCEDNLLVAVHLWMLNHPGPPGNDTTERNFQRLFSIINIERCTLGQMLSIAENETTCTLLRNRLSVHLHQQPITPVRPTPSAPPQRTLVVVGGRHGNNDRHAGILTLTDSEWTRVGVSAISKNCDFYSVATGLNSIFFSGGFSLVTSQPSYDVRQYCLQTLQWSDLTNLPVARERHGSACVNAKLCVFGGQLTHSSQVDPRVDILDLTTGIWTGGQSMLTPVSHGGVAVSRSDIIVVGGDIAGTVCNKTQMYKVDMDQWFPCADMPESREFASHSTVAVDRTVYVLAGGDFMQYNIGTNQWTTLEQSPLVPLLWSAMVLDSGKLKVIGGLDVDGNTDRRIQTYDPWQRTWCVEHQTLHFPLAYHSAFMV